MRLPYSELQATYRVLSPFRLPHHAGSLVRGILGRALRLTSCTATPACPATCERPETCTYSALFDPPLPSPLPHRLLRGDTQAPPRLLPLLPPPGALELAPDATFTLAVRVLGRLEPQHEHHLVSALERIPDLKLGLGRDAGRVSLEAVTFLGPRNRLSSLPSPDSPDPDLAPSPPPRRATLTFETPVWLEHDKRLVLTPDFRTIFRSIHGRATRVCALYGELAPDHEEHRATLDALAREIECHPSLRPIDDWQRHSLERGERHPLKGLLGSVTLAGDLAPFVPILQLAEITHMGKSTSQGLGRLHVSLP